jgi:hypothetical protein
VISSASLALDAMDLRTREHHQRSARRHTGECGVP